MIAAFENHARHPFFDVVDGCLTVSGRSLLDLAQGAGQTPFYVYALVHIVERISQLRQLLPREVRLHYSVKANSMALLVRHLSKLVDGLDVASGGELRIALDTGIDPERIGFAGPGKRVEELASAAMAGVTVSVESELELKRLAEVARHCGRRPRVILRVNPDFELRASGMKMSGGSKPFGIDAENVPLLLANLAKLPIDFVGFHIYSGSQSLRPDAIVEAYRRSLSLAIELSRHAPDRVRLLNLGGGFGIPYFPGEEPLDVAPIGLVLRELVVQAAAELGAELVLELGRYLVGEAGLYVCRVIDRKVSRGKVFLVADGGLHHHLAATGNLGSMIRRNYPVLIANRVSASRCEVVSVVGPLCTPLDLLADSVALPQSEVGDLVAVFQSGAYSMTASPLQFLSHPPPKELLIE